MPSTPQMFNKQSVQNTGQKGHRIMDFTTLSGEALASALALDVSTASDALLASALVPRDEAIQTLFAIKDEDATPEQADAVEAITASVTAIKAEQQKRADEAKASAAKFAAAREAFAATAEAEADEATDEADEADENEGEDADEADEPEADEADAEDGDQSDEDADADADGDDDGGDAGEGESTVTASGTKSTKAQPSAAKRVGARTKRPAVADASPVTITAAADVQGFSNGQTLDGMADVAKAVQARVKGFAPWNKRAAQQVNSQSGGAPVLSKFGAASFGLNFDGLPGGSLTASSGASAEYDAVGEAVKAHKERINASLGFSGDAAMTAAMAWCAPSEVVYNWIADYVVDGLKTLPQVSAPRGGLMLTEGPQLAQTTYADPDDFGFGGTETEMEAGYVKTCETIECPEFTDHRLDFSGYCWKIPILTEKTFPELVADALRLSDVLYAHKMNRRRINDIIAESTAVDASSIYGGSVVDTLEALVQVAVKERRWWNVGENAVMEVTLPQYAREIFKFDMARRSGLALNDIATDQKVAAYFANHRLAVDYVSDFDDVHGAATPTAVWPNNIRAIMYPAGTFVEAVEDVINLSAVYDAASLSQNEYTGVFFEQGVMTIKRGYRSHVLTIPVCTAGTTGANAFLCDQFGSF